MSDTTQQVVQNSSAAAPNQATGGTGASGGTAGSNSTELSSVAPTPIAVVAPKGFRQDLQQMLQGWQTVVPSSSTVTSSDGPLAQGAVLEKLQGILGVYSTLDAHATALQQARVQEKSQLPEAHRFYEVLKASVIGLFGTGSPQLAQFGLLPKKPRRALTSSQLTIRAMKAETTRKLRGTMGKKQKAPIKAGAAKYAITVQQTTPDSASLGTEAASTASPVPTVNAVGSPTASK